MKIIAHRGAANEAPENSMAAFDLAIQAKADGVEVDARLSRDGKVYLAHDEQVLTDLGHRLQIEHEASTTLEAATLNNGQPLASLATALDNFGKTIDFTIELKSPGSGIASAVARDISALACKDNATVSSFCPSHIEELRDNHPDIRRALVWSPCDTWLRPIHWNLPPLIMKHLDCQEIWPRYDLLGETFMDCARQRAWQVIPWVPMATADVDLQNVRNFWGQLLEFQVDGVCTNCPRELRKWLLTMS